MGMWKRLGAFYRKMRSEPGASSNRQSPIIAQGGRKRRTISEIKRIRELGMGREGTVHEVEIKFTGGKRQIKRRFAEKSFTWPPAEAFVSTQPSFGQPRRQFELMQELQKLNRKKNLRLNIFPTIRLLEEGTNRERLLLTKMDFYESPLTDAEMQEVEKQEDHAKRTLRKMGFTLRRSSFKYTKDPITGKLKVWIADFGKITKAGDIEPGAWIEY